MINALIVDDETKAVVVLRKLLAEHSPEVKILGEASRVDKAIELIQEHKPQLIFLDIEMPGKSGFDLLEKIAERNFHVIFVSAHSEFALKAFRFSVTDYLLKPVGIEELKQAVKKVKDLIDGHSSGHSMQHASEFASIQTLRIPTTEGTIFVYLSNIVRMEAEGAYTNVYVDNGKKYMVSDYLKQVEDLVDPSLFMRVHRSHTINLKKIKKVIDRNGLFAEMEDGALVEVSRRIKSDFLKRIH